MGVISGRSTRVPRRGFSLVEAIIAGSIVMLLFGAAIAALSVTTRTVDPPRPVREARTVRAALDRFAADVSEASGVSLVSGQSVTLTIPLRDEDADDGESPTVTWSYRSASATVERTDIDGSTVAVLTGVTAFSLDTLLRRDPTAPILIEATPERLLVGSPHHGTAIEVGPSTLTGYALVTAPVLPSTVTAWKVTGLRVRGRRGSASSNSVTFELRSIAGGFPSGTLLASAQVRGTTFPVSTDWVTIDWTDVEIPASTTAVGVVITSSSLLPPVLLETTTIVQPTPWDTLYSGTLVLWTSLGTSDLSYELLGTYTAASSSLAAGIDGLRMTVSVNAVPGESFSRTERIPTRALTAPLVVTP